MLTTRVSARPLTFKTTMRVWISKRSLQLSYVVLESLAPYEPACLADATAHVSSTKLQQDCMETLLRLLAYLRMRPSASAVLQVCPRCLWGVLVTKSAACNVGNLMSNREAAECRLCSEAQASRRALSHSRRQLGRYTRLYYFTLE